MMGNPTNTEVCEKEKPSDYDSSWTSESTDTECGGTDEPACSTDTTAAPDAALAQVEVEKIDAIEELAQVEGEEIDAIIELAQVEAAVYDYWEPDCAPGMLC